MAELAQLGPTLVVLPSLAGPAVLAGRLRRAGGDVALLPGEWAAGAGRSGGGHRRPGGGLGARVPGLAAVVVIDGHDEGLGQEQAPTWNAVDVRPSGPGGPGVPCVVVSACPTLELLAAGFTPHRRPARRAAGLGRRSRSSTGGATIPGWGCTPSDWST